MSEVPKFVRQRAAQPAAGEHPDANLLSAFAEGGLSKAERTQVLAHLGQCAACRDIVALALPEISAAEAVAPRAAKQWSRWPMLRWAGMAAALVVVAAAVLIRQSSHPGAVPVTSTVAERVVHQAAADKPESKPAEPAMAGAPSASRTTPKPAQAAGAVTTAKDGAAKETRERDSAGKLAVNDAFVPKQDTKQEADRASARNQAPASMDLQPMAKTSEAAEPRRQAAPAATAPGAPGSALVVESQQQSNAGASQQQRPDQNQVGATQSPFSAGEQVQQQVPRAHAANETLSVTAASPSVQRAKKAGAPVSNAVLTTAAPRWRVSSQGTVERSTDAGRTWHLMPVAAEAAAFRSIASVDGEVWAAGTGGALYHSADGGRTWKRVPVIAEDMVLAADIARVEFTDTRHGTVTTTAGERWTTSDGGATWSIRPR